MRTLDKWRLAETLGDDARQMVTSCDFGSGQRVQGN
jgi:hypothetical protein